MEDPVVTTVLSYEAKADEYVQNTDSLAYFPDLPEMLDKFVSLTPGKTVLDVAFGSGRDSLYLIEKGFMVHGVELTQTFIDVFQRKSSIPLFRMDMRHLAFVANSFDGIWCCAAFLHIPRHEALDTLKGFHRVLKPEGILYLDLKLGEGEEWKTEGNVNEVPRFFTYYTPEEANYILNSAGFDTLFVREQYHAKDPLKKGKPTWLNILCKKPAGHY